MKVQRQKLNNLYLGIIALFGLLLFTQCDKGEIYSSFVSLQEANWDKNQMAVFDIRIDNVEDSYDTNVVIRNNNDYSFQNLWLFIDCKSPNGQITKDSLNIELADVYGKWHGKGINVFEYVYSYKEGVNLYPDTGVYVYSIRQGMRAESLKGISDIGMIVSKKVD